MTKIAEHAREYVIGVDGGGSKTVAILADISGQIAAKSKTGSSHPRHLGAARAIANTAQVIGKVLKKAGRSPRILATFLGLPAMEEEFKYKKEIIRNELLRQKNISPIFKGEVIINSDQLAGFRAGTDKKDGVMLNGASGAVAHGWRGGKEVKVSGWGYLTEEGSSFWIGQKGLQAVWDDLDERGPKTRLTKLFFKKFGIKNKIGLMEKVYSGNTPEAVAQLSYWVNEAAKKGDNVSKGILAEAGEELALSAETVIKRLNFESEKFPLVLVGSLFNSEIISEAARKEIRKFSPKAEFIRPKVEPAIGAVKVAIDAVR